MSLDMYLYRKQHAQPGTSDYLTVTKDGERYELVPEFPTMVREEIGYWREAHSIHAWLTDHVPNAKIDGQEHRVSREQLRTLYHIVLEVIKSIELKSGDVFMGRTYDDGKAIDDTRPGMVIKDTTKAEALLPKPWTPDRTAYGYDYRYFEELVTSKLILELVLDSDIDVEFTFFACW